MSRDPAAWYDLWNRLVSAYGPIEGRRRFDALSVGTEPDLIRWRNLGKRDAA